MRRPALFVLFLCVLTFFLGLGRPAITDSDEAFYAESAREMVERNDWLTPFYNHEHRWQKPILYYWLTAVTYLIVGLGEWSARCWSALSGVGLAFATSAAGRRMTRHDDVGWLAGAITATSFGYFSIARMSLPDLPLALFTTVTIAALFATSGRDAPALRPFDPSTLRQAQGRPELNRGATSSGSPRVQSRGDKRRVPPSRVEGRRCSEHREPWSRGEGSSLRFWATAGLAAGLGFLTKGPLALVIPVLVAVPCWWRERHRTRVCAHDVAVAACVFAIASLPWFVGMTMTHGVAYLHSFFVGDNLQRFATDRFNEPRPFLFYVPILLGGLLPWTAYLVVGAWRPLRDLVARRLAMSDTDWRLIIWVGMPLLFFSLSIGKQPRYILPVLPPLAIMVARGILRRLERAHAGDRGARRALRGATLATAALALVLAVLLWRARPLFITVLPSMTWIAIGALAACAMALSFASRGLAHLLSVVPVTSAIMLLAIQFGALSGWRPEPVEEMAALVLRHRTAQERVGGYHAFVRNLIFYVRFSQENLFDEARAAEFLASSDRVLLVVRDADLPRLEALAGVTTRWLGQVRYVNSATLKLPQLLSPLPEQDVQRILLVSNR